MQKAHGDSIFAYKHWVAFPDEEAPVDQNYQINNVENTPNEFHSAKSKITGTWVN